jgi:hypothetical protein
MLKLSGNRDQIWTKLWNSQDRGEFAYGRILFFFIRMNRKDV